MPHEIDNFVNALRNDPLLKNDFPEVLLADIKRAPGLQRAQPMANFSLICLPNPNGPAPPRMAPRRRRRRQERCPNDSRREKPGQGTA